MVALFFYKKKHSMESFMTQFLTWGLFTLGFNTVGSSKSNKQQQQKSLHIFTLFFVVAFNFIADPKDKIVILKLFATLTFVFYALYVYYDDFDYVGKEKNELLTLKVSNCCFSRTIRAHVC